MSLTREEVEKVSLLARLRLSEAELDQMTRQLGTIVEYVELIAEVDTTGVEPMAHVADVANVFRDDEVRPSLPRDEALRGAPNHDDECYRVPAVMGD
ncbi:MAG: Asp-tRNA(Asn)/Glu-tRNA(Gln) amidotransferase subunit GatC [Pirellulales bacterium]|nr:Asp-tRNA(Asn)/Glu-tRNA(Gln) amidotransferase subunit GatC [Planctomycetales bacterium]